MSMTKRNSHSSPGDESRNFYDHVTHWIESFNPFLSEAEPFD